MENIEQKLFNTPLFDNLRKLISIIDELRDVGLQEFINLPRIVVVGTQSSGKSSLLENIVGLDFLPRGDGVVTRRPLEMRLVHTPGIEKPWAKFEEVKGEKFSDFEKVRDKIIAGSKKGIVNIPIVLTIYSSSCPDLTLVDLPGITRISIEDQDANIEKITKDMATHYMKDERTIILCVIPANQDMSTSDGLQLAREIDNKGNRTIGVITKIDIMDRGTNARKMLMNEVIPLKLGYVGVKNRSQQDIIDKIRVVKAVEDEQKYFSSHTVYSTMPPGFLGTKSLTQKLTTVMFHHIRKVLPQIIKEINQKIRECEDKLKDLGPPMPRETKDKMHLLWNIVTDFTENFKNTIKGKYDGKRHAKLQQEVSGGAMIKMMFNDLYKQYTKKDFRATSDYSDRDIEKAIILHQGDSIPGFPSIDAFLFLIHPQLEKLKEPSLECLQTVYMYLDSLSTKLIEKSFARFPGLIDEISDTVSKVLNEEKEKAKEVLENIIESEQGYLFTNDYEYLLNRTSILPALDTNSAFILELRARIDAYFSIVIRNVRDAVPKAIGHFLVKSVQEKMQFCLYTEINRNEEIMNQLGEVNIYLIFKPPHIAEERDTMNKILSVLKRAQKVLKKDPDLAAVDLFERDREEMSSSKIKEKEDATKKKKVEVVQQPPLKSKNQPLANENKNTGPIANNSLFG